MHEIEPGLADTGVGTDAGSLALTVIYTDVGWRVVKINVAEHPFRARFCCCAHPGPSGTRVAWSYKLTSRCRCRPLP